MNNKIFVFNLNRIKNSKEYFLPILLGVLFKLNTIALFIAPITAIKSISDGTLSPRVKTILDSLNLPSPNDKDLLFFFLISITLALVSLLVIRKLKTFYISKIQNKLFNKFKKQNYTLTKNRYSQFKQKIQKLEDTIKNYENITFCGTLVLFIIFYDIQIAFIILVGGYIFYRIIIHQNSKPSYDISRFIEDYNSNVKNINEKLISLLNKKGKDKKILKPLISTIVMLTIMLVIYTRTNSSISIIFIFLVRIYQNQMLNSIQEFVKNKNNQYK